MQFIIINNKQHPITNPTSDLSSSRNTAQKANRVDCPTPRNKAQSKQSSNSTIDWMLLCKLIKKHHLMYNSNVKNIRWFDGIDPLRQHLHTHLATAGSPEIGDGWIDATIWADDSAMAIGFGRWIGAIVGLELPCCLCVLSKFFHGHKEIWSIPT